MSFRKVALIALPAATALMAIGSFAPANAATNNLVVGHCSGKSHYSLQVQRETRTQLSVDWGVDMVVNKAGVLWSYSEANNGVVFTKGTAKTIADGSWSRTVMTAAKGTNKITATAKNTTTGETCSATTTI
jgi:hypothetical protein